METLTVTPVVATNVASIFGNNKTQNMDVTTVKGTAIELDVAGKTKVTEIISAKPLLSYDDKELLFFGAERQRALSVKLDEILSEINKGTSPVLFELFRQLKK